MRVCGYIYIVTTCCARHLKLKFYVSGSQIKAQKAHKTNIACQSETDFNPINFNANNILSLQNQYDFSHTNKQIYVK